MYRDIGMTYWLKKAEAKAPELMDRLALIAGVSPRTPRRAGDAQDQHRLRQTGRGSLGANGPPVGL
jgi:hypothetical protein